MSNSVSNSDIKMDDKQQELAEAFRSITDLKTFLLTAPTKFTRSEQILRFRLPTEEEISCVRWDGYFYITGTDIVRCITHRFAAFGREITNRKKFEEGIFSDLRNLKIDKDAKLEPPKSKLLEFLYKHHCVRTKKKQKVFFWCSVHHDRLFIDVLERELKKEAAAKLFQGSSECVPPIIMSSEPSTRAIRDPALSFQYDPSLSLRDQMSEVMKRLPSRLAAVVGATVSSSSPRVVGQPFVDPGAHGSLNYYPQDHGYSQGDHQQEIQRFYTPPPNSTPVMLYRDHSRSQPQLGSPLRTFARPSRSHQSPEPGWTVPSSQVPPPPPPPPATQQQQTSSPTYASYGKNSQYETPSTKETTNFPTPYSIKSGRQDNPDFLFGDDEPFPLDILIKEDHRNELELGEGAQYTTDDARELQGCTRIQPQYMSTPPPSLYGALGNTPPDSSTLPFTDPQWPGHALAAIHPLKHARMRPIGDTGRISKPLTASSRMAFHHGSVSHFS